MNGQIQAAVDTELATKGLTRTESDGADLYIGYQLAVSTEKQYTSFDSGWGYGPGWYGGGWYGGGGGMTTGTTSTIYIGQIAVDMYQPAAKKLVWRGTASKTIDTRAKPDKAAEEPAESDGEASQELPTAREEVALRHSRRRAQICVQRAPGSLFTESSNLFGPHAVRNVAPTCQSGSEGAEE